MDNSINTHSTPRWEKIGEKDNRILYRVLDDKISVAKYDIDRFEKIVPKCIDDLDEYNNYKINNPSKVVLRGVATMLTIGASGIAGFLTTKKLLKANNKILGNIASLFVAFGTAMLSTIPAMSIFQIPHYKDMKKDFRQLQCLNIKFEKNA